jgi:hypothetical protein
VLVDADHDGNLGVWTAVKTPGTIRLGDAVVVEEPRELCIARAREKSRPAVQPGPASRITAK